jgi:integrase
MATLNLTLDTRRIRKDGTYPLVFRIRLDKQYRDIATGYTLTLKQFDLKTSSVLKDDDTNNELEQIRAHYVKRLRSYLVSNIGSEDLKDIRNYLVNKLPDEITIDEFWKTHISSLQIATRNGGARVYSMCLSAISTEMDLHIPFSKLTHKDLLALETKLYKRGMAANGISVYMRTFRALYNKAIDCDLVKHELYPFRKFKIKRTKTSPRVMSIEELKKYFNLDLPKNHKLYRSWLIGKLIFLLRGINLKDLLLLSTENIRGNRIIYKRAKTGKIYSVKILDEVSKILLEFQSNKTLLSVFNDNDLKDKEKLVSIHIQKRKVINQHLKKIGILLQITEPISTYVFRYSYANLAKQIGYSKDLIAEALGHEYGNSVTGIYLEQFDLALVDDMNESVFDAVR